MNDREAFLRALERDEDDTPTRLVFADWLDEQGEHEEADRMRKWPAAKAWLVEFCEKNNPAVDEEDPYEWVIDYETLVELGKRAMEDTAEGIGFSCGNNMTMAEALSEDRHEFWSNWSIVTGIPVPTDLAEHSSFRCAC
jgi:uncharacterized protein (TIGR02996 family)